MKSGVQVIQRRLDDNLKIRQYKRDLTVLEDKMLKLDAEIKTYAIDSIEQQYNSLKKRHEELVGEVRHYKIVACRTCRRT